MSSSGLRAAGLKLHAAGGIEPEPTGSAGEAIEGFAENTHREVAENRDAFGI